MVLNAPSAQPTFSPAFSLQIYPGKNLLSYSPAIYYDFIGKNDAFDNLQRLRLECWAFYYPVMEKKPNLKIGVSPFISIRTAGEDQFDAIEYGGVITVKFDTSFMKFF
jgi:hypothetical protein